MKIEKVYQANRIYFGKGNMEFFGDIDYSTIQSASGKWYFLNHTNMWSDMFSQKKTPCYRVSPLNQITGVIGDMFDTVFPDMGAVKACLENK